ncbi:MAG: hypothetical protein QOJ65_2462 [Fimbriimonadaceae bacterium]|jgi:hypothetical protein|nr:hypothetical protein [Fimbriimonadaceae bacterium]
MTARDAGGIASRVLAIYLGMHVLNGIVVLPSMIVWDRKYHGSIVETSTFTTLSGVVFTALAALILWVNAKRFWPSETPIENEPRMDHRAWLSLAVAVMGLYYLVTYGPVAMVTVLRATLQTSIAWPQFDLSQVFTSCFRTVAALIMIGWGMTTLNRRISTRVDVTS